MIVFGLGNPGTEYEGTRHNAGFITVEKMAAKMDAKFRKRCLRLYSACTPAEDLTLVKPLTFMNRSGDIFHYLVKEGDDAPIVVVDNMDLPVGRIRIKVGGSSAGHNGLKSIISAIGPEFIRIYVGIGRPLEGTTVTDHVLSRFTDEERIKLDGAVDHAIEAVESLRRGEDIRVVIQRANSSIA